MFLGVDPEREVALTRFLDTLVAGAFPVAGRYELVIGEEMGRQLSVGVGDELVLVGSGADGSMANDLYTLAGIYRTGLVEFDASTVVMPIGDLQELVVLSPDRIHEIAVATAEPGLAPDAARRLSGVLEVPARPIVVASWAELNPVLAEYVALGESFYWIIIVIVFAVAAFGIANTMLMATFERRREFAVMLALGSTPRAVVGIVVSEALAIGAVSLAGSAVFTFPLMAWLYNRAAQPGMALRERHPAGRAAHAEPARGLQRAGLDLGIGGAAVDGAAVRPLSGGSRRPHPAGRHAVGALRPP